MATDEADGDTQPLVKRDEDEPGSSCLKARHSLALLAFLGFFNVYCMRVNLSVALVAMVNSTSSQNYSDTEECPDHGATTSTGTAGSATTGEFNWDENTQALVLGSFFYGYTVTQVPGGWLAEKIGGKRLFGYGCLCTALLTLLTPVAARAGVPYLVAVRILEGMGENVLDRIMQNEFQLNPCEMGSMIYQSVCLISSLFPAMYGCEQGVTAPAIQAMWSMWAPLYERSKLAGFAYSGCQLGTVFAMPISGLLCQHGFAGGWPSVFYVFGALGCAWFVLWMLLVHDSPGQHPRISDSERRYIEMSVGLRQANGFLSEVPYIILWLTQMTSGLIVDFLRKGGCLTTVTTRKLMNTVGLMCPACLLVATGYTGCDHTLAVVLLTLGVGGAGFTMGGYNVNHLDIAPEFAGTLMGITNGIATIPGFLGPAVVGILTNNNQTMGQWRKFFYITAGIYLTGVTVFLLLAKGEEQHWAESSTQSLISVTVKQEHTDAVQEDQVEAGDIHNPLIKGNNRQAPTISVQGNNTEEGDNHGLLLKGNNSFCP